MSRTKATHSHDEIQACEHLLTDRHFAILTAAANGASYAEISRSLSLPFGTVKSRLHRARLEIAFHLEEQRKQRHQTEGLI